MKTQISHDISLAAEWLASGSNVAIPTETVYGLAANIFSESAVNQVYQLKKRPSSHPLIVHISAMEEAEGLVCNVPEAARTLAKSFWPGPLSLILPKSSRITHTISGGRDTVALRVPDHPLTLELLRRTGFPLAAPSANPYGCISPTQSEHVLRYFDGKIPMILEGGPCRSGVESTIIGFVGNNPVVYRLGAIPLERIEDVTGPLTLSISHTSQPMAPGMDLRHYSPETPLCLCDDPSVESRSFKNQKLGFLFFQFPGDEWIGLPNVEILPFLDQETEAAAQLYAALHRLDRSGVDLILAQRCANQGLGRTINDRLSRAAEPAAQNPPRA